MADLYRKNALDSISNPDRLNTAFVITSPLSWFALLGITLIIIVVLIWSIIGRIPETVTLNGKIVSSTGSTNAIYTDDSGVVQEIYSYIGRPIQNGDPVVRLFVNGESKDVLSDQVGIVTKVNVQIGNTVTSGMPLLYVSPLIQGSENQVAVCYASSSITYDDAGKLALGMEARVSLPSVDSQASGYIEGHIINIDRYTTSANSITELFTDSQVASDISKNGAVKAVTIELAISAISLQGAKNNFAWSNSKGNQITINNGDSITVRVVTKQVRPIDKLFKRISEVLGENP